MQIRPITFRAACAFVTALHRHHKAPRGHKFSLAVVDDTGEVLGVAMIGRPIARHDDDGLTAEVIRTCTNGSPNTNSMLYGASARACKAMGYRRIITFTQQGESGASLKASGFVKAKDLPPRKSWADSSVSLKHIRHPIGAGNIARIRWQIIFTGKTPQKSLTTPTPYDHIIPFTGAPSMPEQITIAGKVFNVPLRYQPGHVLTAAEAIALNQAYHEALRNNFSKRVKDQLEHGHFDPRVLQLELDAFAAEYEFGSKRNRSRVPKAAPDPVLVEAQKIARQTLNDVLRERGLDATPEAKARKVAQWVEEKEWIMAQARERLAERAHLELD